MDKPELVWLRKQELAANEKNWRTHPPTQKQAFTDLLNKVGWAGVVLYNKSTGKLVDGHLRLETVPDDMELPVLAGEWTPDQEALILANLDPIAGMAGIDVDKYTALAAQVIDSKELAISAEDTLGRLMEAVANGERRILPNAQDRGTSAWTPEEDTSQGTCVDTVGYDLTSVWPRTGDQDTKVHEYFLPLPAQPGEAKNSMRRNYSRSPALEMERIVQTYMREKDYFLEVCAGWGTFSASAAVHGYSGEAVDIWDVSVSFIEDQMSVLPADAGKVKVRLGDALALPYEENQFDFVYCNPPFWQLEKYSDAGNDLASVKTMGDWLGKSGDMMSEMLRVAKPGSLIVTVMADYREKGKLIPLHTYWIDEAVRRGLELHDLVVQTMRTENVRVWRQSYNRKRTVKAHEYVITFRKPASKGKKSDG